MKFNLQDISKKINIPLSEWAGNCHYIATAFVKHQIVEGMVRYGHYLGPIDKNSIFAENIPLGFTRHGWIEKQDSTIIDPTRYAFENVEPYVYHGLNNKYYDIGGNIHRTNNLGSAPMFNPANRQIDFIFPLETLAFVKSLFPGGKILDKTQAFYLGNLSPGFLGRHAYNIYMAFKEKKQDAFIPIDNWDLIMGHEKES
jgi:hypothetical protein